MELLVFGIDGGDLEIMKSFDMPYFKNLLKDHKTIKLEEDLFNRGWAEILTGKYGKDTRGFYMAPKLDDSLQFATSFKMQDLEGNDEIVPLWSIMERAKIPYCIMNVPTTTPVPRVKYGIVIGSAGGGLNKVEGVPKELVSDEETLKYLESKNYKVDLRIPNTEIENTQELFEQLAFMESNRTKYFVEIAKKNKSKFGFLVDRGTTIVHYLARNEIEKYMLELDSDKKTQSEWVRNCLLNHYSTVDKNIQHMVEELQPKNIIITADHNHLPHKYLASVTPFLRENKWLFEIESKKRLIALKPILNKMGLLGMVKRIRKTVPTLSRIDMSQFDMEKSVAFGSPFIAGIYINDERFNGIVKSDSERRGLIDSICEKFNQLEESERRGMVAKPYRENYLGHKFSDCLPDIILENFEGMHFQKDGVGITWKNEDYFREIPKKLKYVNRPEFTGDKGPNPILVISSSLENIIQDADANDLTLVYKIIDRYINSIDGRKDSD